jgi:uncharacterized membrane protein
MRRFHTQLVFAAVALLAGTAALTAPASAAQPASVQATSSGCYFVANYIDDEIIPWSNGGSGTGCYSIDPSGRIYQSTVGSSSSLSQIPGGGNADGFYYGYWENSNDRRICVYKSGHYYYDTYVLGGTGWRGWTSTNDPSSVCPYS